MSRIKSTPIVETVTAERTFNTFDSLMAVDAGSDGFKLKDENGTEIVWPSGIPFSIGKQEGKASGPITITEPDSGSLNVSVIFYR
jgi:hypothetical protein